MQRKWMFTLSVVAAIAAACNSSEDGGPSQVNAGTGALAGAGAAGTGALGGMGAAGTGAVAGIGAAGTGALGGMGAGIGAGTGALGGMGAGFGAGTGGVGAGTGAGTGGVGAGTGAGAGGTGSGNPLCPECDAMGNYPDIRGTGSCVDLNTPYPGDETCLPPPEPGEGIQIHIGPEDYNNPGDYEFPPNLEHSLCRDFVTPNSEDVYYQSYVLSARPGTHHIINSCFANFTANPSQAFHGCIAPAGVADTSGGDFPIPGASKPYMPRPPVAPENVGLGDVLPASSHCQADLHYFNFTQAPVLKEFWLNLYTIPQEEITERQEQIRGMGGFTWLIFPIAPGTDMVYQYQCPVGAPTGDNPRITTLLGHYHAHGVRFTAWLNDAKVFEMFDYNEPRIFYYNSVTQNPEFAPELMQAGASTGPLPLAQGDVLKWECHIINDSNVGLTYTNEVETGEMCNLWGGSVGVPKIDCQF